MIGSDFLVLTTTFHRDGRCQSPGYPCAASLTPEYDTGLESSAAVPDFTNSPSIWHYPEITNVLRGIYGPINPVAYQTTGDYAAGDRVLGILCSVGSVALDHPQVKFLLKPAFKGEKLDIRMYETIPAGAQILLPTFPGKHLLVLNGMTPNDSAEGTFNDWYAEEHIPMLSAVPGWRSSRRFRLRAASTSPPVYLALHEWDSYDAFGTPEFVAATNTPWRTRVVVEQVDKKERHLMEYLGVLEDLGRRSG